MPLTGPIVLFWATPSLFLDERSSYLLNVPRATRPSE